MRLLFSWSLVPPKLISWRARLCYRVTERIQQVRFLPSSRSQDSLFPIGQNVFHISFRALQRLKVCFDTPFLGQAGKRGGRERLQHHELSGLQRALPE